MFEDGLRAGVGTDIYEAATPSWVASHTGAKKGTGTPLPSHRANARFAAQSHGAFERRDTHRSRLWAR
eukprot:7146761-Prymnesium_polylepis.1